MVGILGKKLGMTQVYDELGKVIPVTLIEAGPCYVLQVKTKVTDGYDAIQIGYGAKREKHVSKPQSALFKKVGVDPLRFVREIRMKDVASYKAGQKIEADLFVKGDFVDVIGTSIGKGFQGGVRRWNWTGGPGGHGSMFHRQIGSIQSGARLGRVTKGHHMPGHMGDDRVTVQNLEVIASNKETSMIAVKGAIPGHINSFVVIQESIKRPKGYVKVKPAAAGSKKKAAKAATAKK